MDEDSSHTRSHTAGRAALVVALIGLALVLGDVNGEDLQAADCRAVYLVESGDTLFGIALAQDSTIREIAAANGIRDVNLILVGQQLCIPHRPTATPNADGFVCHDVHMVEQGDNLEAIARKYGSSVSAIVAANPRRLRHGRENILESGYWLCIP
jgi:hypothetical protein